MPIFRQGDYVRHKRSGRLGRVDLTDEQTEIPHYVTVIWRDGEGHGACAEVELAPAKGPEESCEQQDTGP